MKQSTTLRVRQAVPEDCKAIAVLSREELGYSCEDMLVKRKLSTLDHARECVFVAELDNDVIGFVHVEKYDTLFFETIANILALAVSSQKHRMGAGRLLMETAEHWASSVGAVGIRLNSRASRVEAHKFYRAIGFLDEKDQKRFMKMI